jgi:HD-GYP domain-containing protein (c-di-GMP phosphodiesterase class II)
MKLGKIIPEQTFLRNKVGRQLFIMFALCALVPLAAMTAVSYIRVSRQLNRQADERMREACKTAGMNLVERLSFLETDLDFLLSAYSKGISDTSWPASRQMRTQLSRCFRGVSLRSASGRLLAGFASVPESISFSREEIEHLNRGKTLIATRSIPGETCVVYLAKRRALGGASGDLILGEVNRDYLWASGSFEYSSADILIVNQAMEVLFSTLSGSIPINELAEAVKTDPSGRLEWSSPTDRFVSAYWTIFIHPTFFDNWIVVYSENGEAVLEPMASFQKTFIPIALLMFWIAAFLSLLFIRRRTKPIEQLQEATRQVAAKDFTARVHIGNKDEFGQLGSAFNKMAQGLESYFDTIQTVNSIGKSLSIEDDEKKLLETILTESKNLIHADGAALYLVSEDQKLKLGLSQIDSLGAGDPKDSSKDSNRSPELPESTPSSLILHEETLFCGDIYAAAGNQYRFQREFDEKTGYRTQSLLSVPLINHEGEVIGLLQLFNARNRQDGTIIPFSEEDIHLVESLASQAAVALSKNRLITEMARLLEGLTALIAAAVDAKSPHTGDHCKRVPILAMMIAEAACRATDGPFKDFRLSRNELFELHIAAMLHDCGKVATPVHIMNKGTRLQTIFDRIELIQTRFEILARDRLVELYEEKLRILTGNNWTSEFQQINREWEELAQELDRDFNFLKGCNSGWKQLKESEKKRVMEIAHKYFWINRNRETLSILNADELENLTIMEGTLTEKERKVINDHVNLTIRMLESLPLPKRLRNLPVHAGSHHERMDGSGYPKGLTREQISIQGRIIGLADVFEAFTAANRPYRRGRSVSEAVEILRSMKEAGKIDPDLFDLFIKENIPLLYASQFLCDSSIVKSA